MKRTTIMIDEETLLELGRIADERNVSASQLVREALAEYVVAARSEQHSARPLPSFIGISDGPADLSVRAVDLVAQLRDLENRWD